VQRNSARDRSVRYNASRVDERARESNDIYAVLSAFPLPSSSTFLALRPSRALLFPSGGPALYPPLSLPLSRAAFREKLRVRVTRLRRVTHRWPDTGKGIPGHWSRRRLNDILSFVGVCRRAALCSTAIEPPRGLLSPSLALSLLCLQLLLPCAISRSARREAAPLFFSSPLPSASRATTRIVVAVVVLFLPLLPVAPSPVLPHASKPSCSSAMRSSSVYGRHCETKASLPIPRFRL